MAVTIAEYLGKRTDSTTQIEPVPIPFARPIPACPFNKLPCKKMDKKTGANFPICSLRRGNELYIVCEHRLASTSGDQDLPLSPYQAKMLLTLAREVLNEDVKPEQVLYKAEVVMKSRSKADYMLSVSSDVSETYGPRKLIVEMQGGGETNNTGTMSRHIKQWTNSDTPTNAFLSAPLGEVSPIQTNAWRRLQEQIFSKASVAVLSQCGFVACIGTIIYDSMSTKLNGFGSIQMEKSDKWNVAFLTYCEDRDGPAIGETIPLKIDYSRVVYTTYDKLVNKLITRGIPDPDAFEKGWKTLSGELFDEGIASLKENSISYTAKTTTTPNNENYQMRSLFDE